MQHPGALKSEEQRKISLCEYHFPTSCDDFQGILGDEGRWSSKLIRYHETKQCPGPENHGLKGVYKDSEKAHGNISRLFRTGVLDTRSRFDSYHLRYV